MPCALVVTDMLPARRLARRAPRVLRWKGSSCAPRAHLMRRHAPGAGTHSVALPRPAARLPALSTRGTPRGRRSTLGPSRAGFIA